MASRKITWSLVFFFWLGVSHNEKAIEATTLLATMTRAREEQIIEAAYKEAKARGLPDGWTCTIDVSCFLEVFCCSVVRRASRVQLC